MKPWNSRWRLTAAAVVLMGAVLVALAWTGNLSQPWIDPSQIEGEALAPSPSNAHPSPAQKISEGSARYAGSHACAQCHAELTEQFSAHPMAQSTRRVEDDPWHAVETHLPAFVPGNERVLKVARTSDGLVHCEQMYDDAGQLIYEQQHAQAYVVGSGRRARAYVERRDALLFMSPLNWYSEADRWGLAPGYQPDDVRRFDRRVTDDCLACHAGRIAAKQPGSNIYQDPPFHEMAIGCERCHGPAAEHVAFHEQARSAPDVDPIVNPVKLVHDRRESVCYQCHLEAAARVLRPGKSHLDFQPGMRLSDIWAILDQGTDVSSGGRTRSVNHVQQMRDSRCYRESQGKMGCISCHDPHRVPPEHERATFYREKCAACHSDQSCSLPLPDRQKQRDNCIVCHMPSLNSNNMAHIAQTDHRVLRKPLSAAAEADGGRPSSLSYFADAADQFSAAERQRGLLLGTFIHCKRKGIPLPDSLMLYLEQLLQAFPQDVAVLNALGAVALEKNDLPAARNYFQRAVQADSDDENSLDGLLDTSYATGDWAVSVECATRLVEIDPSNARVHALRGDAWMHLGQIDKGLADVERAVELNPGVVPLREWLVEQYRKHDMTDKLERELEILQRVRGAHVPEAINEPRS